MFDQDRKNQFGSVLEHIADSLDIPESRYLESEERYKAVGKWLSKEDSPSAVFSPEIYPQGSFRVGTVVKPISKEDKYDIDLVCQLDISKHAVTQQALKKMVGDRLKANQTYAAMLDEEGRRCWTLNYADSAMFHMDILPAIPDDYGWLLGLGVPTEFAQNALCITDKKRWNTDPDWPRSNPKGYALWFREQMKVIFESRKEYMAEQLRANIEDVPDYKVKTPLQRAIQILKRHRDIMFENDYDDKPISIIITTLASHAYNNEADLFDALSSIIDGMPNYILEKGGNAWIPNPVDPLENFADKWQEKPEKQVKFRRWLLQVREDLSSAFEEIGIHKVADRLKPAFGERAVNDAMKRMGDDFRTKRESGLLSMAAGTGILGNMGTTSVKDHTFYGE